MRQQVGAHCYIDLTCSLPIEVDYFSQLLWADNLPKIVNLLTRIMG
jgi:hypothetical protein